MKELNYFVALDRLIEKSSYFWEQHVQCLLARHYIEAEMWEKKSAANDRILQRFITKMQREIVWLNPKHQTN